MKIQFAKAVVIGIALSFSIGALAGPLVAKDGSSGTYVVNSVSLSPEETCFVSNDARTPKPYYIYLYISQRRGSYNPSLQQRVILWLSDCSRRINRAALEGHRVALVLKTNQYSPNWDLQISNYESYGQMTAASTAIEGVTFDVEPVGLNELVMQVGATDRIQRGGYVIFQSKEGRKDDYIILNHSDRTVTLAFSNRWGNNLSNTFDLPARDFKTLEGILLQTKEDCPLQITYDFVTNEIKRIVTTCQK